MSDNQGDNQPAPESQQAPLQNRLIEFVKTNKIDVALWATRVLTIFFTIGYIIPIFG